ncbi:MAG: YdcF family protein [Pyrinomonadaceae bacterium]|nr:YdcF family protein [Pyrinomonadaceae bacterium]
MKKIRLKFKVLIILLTLFLIWILLAPFLATLLIVEKPLENAEAIWVLGGSGTYLERTQFAAEIYKKGLAKKIFLVNDGVFGGWDSTEKRNLPFFELSKRELISQGVPSEAIECLPENVTGTNYEADLFAKIATERNLISILLVTSAYHSRRALWTFQKSINNNNLSVEIGIKSPPAGIQTPPKFTWWLSQKGWMMVGGEYVKFIYYWSTY